MYQLEDNLYKAGYHYIAGTDEAGRGPMAGPLVAAAVVLDPFYRIADLNDSKKLTSKKRAELYDVIMAKALEVKVEFIDVQTLDRINVYQASKLAMERCVNQLSKVDYCLSDAMKLDLDIPMESIIKGDSKSASIAAASIIAKVTRDRYMMKLDALYPEYGFKNHKGYVTKKHLTAITEFGIIDDHRRSFKPIQDIINHQNKDTNSNC